MAQVVEHQPSKFKPQYHQKNKTKKPRLDGLKKNQKLIFLHCEGWKWKVEESAGLGSSRPLSRLAAFSMSSCGLSSVHALPVSFRGSIFPSLVRTPVIQDEAHPGGFILT
jgi:hypothetical protein